MEILSCCFPAGMDSILKQSDIERDSPRGENKGVVFKDGRNDLLTTFCAHKVGNETSL
jgi:hypothetical protein